MRIAVYVRSGRVETAGWADQQLELVADWFLDAGLLTPETELVEIREVAPRWGGPARPVLRWLVESADFDAIAVVRLDRLARTPRDLAETLTAAVEHGKRVWSVTEGFDSADAASRQMLTMLTMFSEQQTVATLAALEQHSTPDPF